MKTAAALAALLGILPIHVSASPAFQNISPMSTARAAHTATLLKDGQVLIVGGFIGDESEHAGIELLDSAQQRFRAIEIGNDDFQTRRGSHTASLLPDGRVLLAGGYAQGRCLDSALIYDAAAQKIIDALRMNSPRCDHTAVTLQDGRVALIGGLGTNWKFLDDVEIFDPIRKSFAMAGRLSVPRTSNISVLLKDGRIFIAGGDTGRGSDRRLYSSTEIFDPVTGRSTPAATMSIARAKHDGVLLADGRVFINGGADERDANGKFDSAEIYDPARDSFSATATMKMARYKHRNSSVLMKNGFVFICGGARQPEIYNPSKDLFTLMDVESPLFGSFSAVTFFGERILITGGYGRPSAPSNKAWLLSFR